MADASDVFLVRGSIQLLEPDLMADWIQFAFTWTAAGVATQFVPDQDYLLVAVSGNLGVMITKNPTILFNNIGGSVSGPRSDIIFIAGSLGNPVVSGFNIKLAKKEKYYLVSTGGGGAVIYLRLA